MKEKRGISVHEHKQTIRKHLIEKRKNNRTEFIHKNSEHIKQKVIDLPVFKQTSHHLYYISYNGEVHTHDLIKEAYHFNKTVYVPISNTTNHTLTISKLTDFNDLIPSSYGILEPKKEKQQLIAADRIDLIIVPGVAFDRSGNRIGQGGGYYDWLLKHSKATSIALAFDFQILDRIPTKDHDQPVDIIVTETEVIHCKKKLGDNLS